MKSEKNKYNSGRYCASVSALALLLTAVAGAAAAAEGAAATEESVGTLGEIVVMSRRKQENLQETPVAVTAINAEGLAARNITRANQIAEVAPNVVFEPVAPLTGSTNNGSIFIRGIGTTEFSLGTEPGVGVYVDDVYLARIMGNVLNVVDIEAIEVLRGPQGTLFGRNSIGGAMIVRSKRPSDKLEASLGVEYGTDDLIIVSGSVDLPVSDKVRTKFSVQRRKQDGYVEDIYDREDFGRQSSWSGRGTLEVQITDNLLATTHVDYMRENNSAAPYVLIDLFESNPIGGGATFVALRNMALGCANGAAGNAGGACVDQFFILGPHKTAFGYEIDNTFINDFNKEPFQSKDLTEVRGISQTFVLDLDKVAIKSVTAYRDLEARNPRNPDHTPYEVLEANSDLEQKQFTQEFQFSGTMLNDRLDWIAGVYYLKESGYQLDSVNLFPVTLHSGGYFENKSWAGFVQASYDVTDTVEASLGVRYTEEDKNYSPESDDFINGRTQLIYEFAPIALGIPGATPADPKIVMDPPIPLLNNDTPLKFEEWTPHADISWKATENLMLYASYSRGYKAGGFEQRIALPVDVARTFDVETVDSYEVGFKSTLANNTLRLNGAIYYTDYKDLQCSVVIGIAPTFINCGDAKIKGFELEGNWVPDDAWMVDFSVGYTDAAWVEGSLTPLASTVGITDSKKFAMVPKWTMSGAVSYIFSLGNNGTITPRVDWSYKSDIEKDAPNTPVLKQEAYHLFNVGVTWLSADERYSVAVKGRNITDKIYLLAGVQQNDGGFAEGIYARGAEWSVALKVKY